MIELYATIQRDIIQRMIELTKQNSPTIYQWEVDRLSESQSLEDYAMGLLVAYKPLIQMEVKKMIQQAQELIDTHLLEQFDMEVEHDEKQQQEEVFNYINLYILRGLISNKSHKGTILTLYHNLIKAIADDVKNNDKSLEQSKIDNTSIVLEKGLDSGYYDKQGNDWKLDRYILALSTMIYQNTYNKAQEQISHELVRVFHYPNPRDACKLLDASGIICIVPRELASSEAQKYPNIYDSEHHYLEAGGHRGINCRHAWHNVEAKQDLSWRLYANIDRLRSMIHTERERLKQLIDSLM